MTTKTDKTWYWALRNFRSTRNHIPQDVTNWLREFTETLVETKEGRRYRWVRLIRHLVQMGLYDLDNLDPTDATDRWLRFRRRTWGTMVKKQINQHLGDIPGAKKSILQALRRDLAYQYSPEALAEGSWRESYGRFIEKEYNREILIPFVKSCL